MQDTSDFYFKNEEGEMVELPRPETHPLSTMGVLIARCCKYSVLVKFSGMIADGVQWDWFETWKSWREAKVQWLTDKGTYEPIELEDGTFTEFSTPEPVEPIRPDPIDPIEIYQDEIRNCYRSQEVENLVVEVYGMKFNANEVSQDRMARTASLMVRKQIPHTTWKLADGTFAEVTADILDDALLAAGLKQTEIWKKYG